MALGRRGPREQRLWIGADELPRSPGHPFYTQLGRLLKESDFDRYVEGLCEPFYSDGKGRPSIPPGVYFRMLFVGYFEGIDSQRGIAWRCSDSLSIRDFLGLGTTDRAPNHSSLTVIRKRLPVEVHLEVFRFVVDMAAKRKLLKGNTIAVDATLLDANAAMKSIVRRDTGETWKEYVKRLAEAEGIKDASDDDLRRFDRNRDEKSVGNAEWESKSDPDSRIMKMKDGRTHLSYKAEHAIDLDSEMIVAATIFHGNVSDPTSLMETLSEAQAVLSTTNGAEIEELVADKGYHEGPTLAACEQQGIRTYVPAPKSARKRRWTDKSYDEKRAVLNNRRRTKRAKSRKLQKLRSEKVERSFAHVCETGGARRTQLRGLEEVFKRYLAHVAGRNLGRILFLLFGIGTPRGLAQRLSARSLVVCAVAQLLTMVERAILSIRTANAATMAPLSSSRSRVLVASAI